MIMTQEKPDPSYDVVVIGGGPAGATAATFLQRKGHRCLILEKKSFPRYQIGESLIPNTYGTLKRLGLLDKLRESHFPKKYSVRFVSPSGEDADPFYFSETLPEDEARTWQVERSEFDVMCLDNARESGVEVGLDTRVEEVLFENDQATGVRISEPDNAEPHDITASVVIDASGHTTFIGNQLKLKTPVDALRKAAIWSYYKGGKRLEGIDEGETTIFRLDHGGWFWYIPLPDDIVSVGIVADPDALFAETKEFKEAFLSQVANCAPLQERLAQATRVKSVRGRYPLAYLNRKTAGKGWVMIGDAAAFLDPIYSSGLFLAMESAELASNCVHDALQSGDLSGERLGSFSKVLGPGLMTIYSLIQAFYDKDFRFRDFVERFPQHRSALIDCLVGDVINKDMKPFLESLAEMTPPPSPLG